MYFDLEINRKCIANIGSPTKSSSISNTSSLFAI